MELCKGDHALPKPEVYVELEETVRVDCTPKERQLERHQEKRATVGSKKLWGRRSMSLLNCSEGRVQLPGELLVVTS